MESREKKNKSFRQKKATKSFHIFAVVFIGLGILIGVICFWYYRQVQRTVRDESSGYLKEVATRIGGNVNQIIDDTYGMLYSFVNTLDQSNADNFADFKSIAENEEHWGYESIILIAQDGSAYDVNGNTFSLTGDVYLRDVVLGGSQSMSPLQIVNGKECAIFAIPLDGRAFDGIPMAAVAVTYDSDVFAQVLSMSSFNNAAYSHIVTKDGTIVIRSSSGVAADFGYNVFASIDKAGLIDPADPDFYKEEIRSNRTGQIEFELDGKREYMVYSPIPPDDWYLLTFVPADVVNAKSNLLLSITLLISGFITISFGLLIVMILTTFRRHQRKLEQIAYVDDVTGGNTIEKFYELSREALDLPDHPQYALIYTNVSKFKVLNESFGRRVGDEILKIFFDAVERTLASQECIGRYSADNFCILLEYKSTDLLCKRFEQWYQSALERIEKQKTIWSLPITEFGIYIIENDSMPITQMIDRAKLSLREVPRSVNSKIRYATYNDEIREQLFREKQLEDMMEEALKNREYQMFLQPKVQTLDGKIVGAEALTRWMSASEGMIYPDEFIPLFEKNGFIVQLDLWIFEEACQLIHSWLESGERPIKISVNCSRVNMRDAKFVKTYLKITERYQVPPHFIEIELTESLVLEDAEYFKSAVREIHDAGFGCSMDDFGSGYSSLNMIKDLDVDTIKLDKIFFRDSAQDAERTESVVRNIISMAKALSMKTVAEGVEDEEQLAMLRRVDCDLIQGYVFSRPIPVDNFLQLKEKNEKET